MYLKKKRGKWHLRWLYQMFDLLCMGGGTSIKIKYAFFNH